MPRHSHALFLPRASSARLFFTELAFACMFVSVPSHALTIEHEKASYNDKHYEFEMVALVDAPLDRVQSVLRDYESYKQLDPRILDARVLERPTSYVTILETTLHVCFGPFCRDVKRVERVEEAPLQLSAVA